MCGEHTQFCVCSKCLHLTNSITIVKHNYWEWGLSCVAPNLAGCPSLDGGVVDESKCLASLDEHHDSQAEDLGGGACYLLSLAPRRGTAKGDPTMKSFKGQL